MDGLNAAGNFLVAGEATQGYDISISVSDVDRFCSGQPRESTYSLEQSR
jgi:hypothetical protein